MCTVIRKTLDGPHVRKYPYKYPYVQNICPYLSNLEFARLIAKKSCRGIIFIMPRHDFYHAAALYLSCRGIKFIMPRRYFYHAGQIILSKKVWERPWPMTAHEGRKSRCLVSRDAQLSPLPAPSPSTMPTTIESNISPPQWHRLLQLMHAATLATCHCVLLVVFIMEGICWFL